MRYGSTVTGFCGVMCPGVFRRASSSRRHGHTVRRAVSRRSYCRSLGSRDHHSSWYPPRVAQLDATGSGPVADRPEHAHQRPLHGHVHIAQFRVRLAVNARGGGGGGRNSGQWLFRQ